MIIVRANEHDRSKGTTFTGEVIMERVLQPQTEGGMSVSIVHFKDGARTNWHVHPGEQILIVVEGEGRVGDGNEEYLIGVGDVVHEGPGVRHWHGAAPGKNMTHISITTVGSPDWQESPEE